MERVFEVPLEQAFFDLFSLLLESFHVLKHDSVDQYFLRRCGLGQKRCSKREVSPEQDERGQERDKDGNIEPEMISKRNGDYGLNLRHKQKQHAQRGRPKRPRAYTFRENFRCRAPAQLPDKRAQYEKAESQGQTRRSLLGHLSHQSPSLSHCAMAAYGSN